MEHEHKERRTQNATMEITADKKADNFWFVGSGEPRMFILSKDIEGVYERCTLTHTVDYKTGTQRMWIKIDKSFHMIYADNRVVLDRNINSWLDLAKYWRTSVETAKYICSISAKSAELILHMKERQAMDKKKMACDISVIPMESSCS